MKNRAMASGAEKVSEKLENLNAELGVRKQNFQRNLAAMQGQRELEFQLSGETPGIGVTANYSERLENLTKKIQQFSVERRQKIQNFEGRGGGRTIPTPVNNMQEFFETDFGEQLKKSVRKTKRHYDGQAIYEVVDKSIPGLKKGDQIYLDGIHKDHIEVFDKRGRFRKVINLDGSTNKIKSDAGVGRSI